MIKFICPNCGFRYGFQTAKIGKQRVCKNCGCTSVKSSEVVLSSVMREHMQENRK